MSNKNNQLSVRNTLENIKEELIFSIYIVFLITIAFIAKSYLASKDMLAYVIYVIQAIVFAVMDLHSCNECYKAEWSIFDWLKKSYPQGGLSSIKQCDIEKLRDEIHRYGLSYSQKSKRMIINVLNSLLVGLISAWFIFFWTSIQEYKILQIIFFSSAFIKMVYCVLLISLIRNYNNSVKRVLADQLIHIDCFLSQNITPATYQYLTDSDAFSEFWFSVIASVAASIIFAFVFGR